MFKDLFNSRFVLASKRLAWIDYARGISIILVCFRHCYEGLEEARLPTKDHHILNVLNICFYSFRMPLFFIVSGLFVSISLAKKGLANFIRNRFNIVFYPLLIWGSLQITLQLIFKNYVNARPAVIDYLYLIIWPRNPSNNQQFWYLNALFFVGVIYAFFRVKLKFRWRYQILLSLVFYSIASYLSYNNLSFYIFPDIFHFYIYFCIGDILASFVLNKENLSIITAPRWVIPSFFLFIVSQTLFTIINIREGNDNYVNLKLPMLFLFISLSGCVFVVQVAQILQKTGWFKWIRVIGYHSLYIYLVHLILIAAVRVLMVHFLKITNIPLILFTAILVGVVIPIIMYNLAVRMGLWWIFSLKKPTEEMQFYKTEKENILQVKTTEYE